MAVKAVACPIPGKVGKRSFCEDWKRYRQVYLMLLPWGEIISAVISIAVTIIIRLLAMHYKWNLPRVKK